MAIHEECGVFGIFGNKRTNVAHLTYYGLYSLQHRGQESCGIVVNDDGVFDVRKGQGLVGEVFTDDVLSSMPQGNAAIGHVRYSTTGAGTIANCQPLIVNHIKGKLAVAHNGNLTNALPLRDELEMNGAIFHSTSDTETICYMIIRERLKTRSIEEAVSLGVSYLEGAYSLCIMSAAKMIAVRDPLGLRPLCYGKTADGGYVVASESCGIHAVGGGMIRDIEPGEMLVFSRKDGVWDITVSSMRIAGGVRQRKSCIFEYIYFARPDSVIDGVSVHEARKQAGKLLAIETPVEADVVMGVPDSGIDAAIGYSMESRIPFETGLVKNKYVGRSFIAPGQDLRTDTVRIKLSPIRNVICGKKIVLIDDSIVRGTTIRRIVDMLKDAGAEEIHLRISSPPFRHPCYYGVDIDSEEYLIASHHDESQIAEILGVDSLAFLSTDALGRMIGTRDFCQACFNGDYPTQIPLERGKDRFEKPISFRGDKG